MAMASFSLSSCLAVVPEPTREWKPEMAPQATVMNSTGKSWLLPVMPPKPVKAGRVMAGCAVKMPTMARRIMP
jgi:hypothetical protein